MLRRTIFALAALFWAGAVIAQAYKWTDENGVVHYSDRPQPGAEQIQLPKANTFSRSSPRPSAATRRSTSGGEESTADDELRSAPFSYESFAISSPGAEETLWNIEGILNVTLNLQPALQPGHRVRVYFDGQPRMVNGTSFQIEEVWRGVHNVQAEVLDETGKLMIRSQPNRFYVQQNTVAGGP